MGSYYNVRALPSINMILYGTMRLSCTYRKRNSINFYLTYILFAMAIRYSDRYSLMDTRVRNDTRISPSCLTDIYRSITSMNYHKCLLEMGGKYCSCLQQQTIIEKVIGYRFSHNKTTHTQTRISTVIYIE